MFKAGPLVSLKGSPTVSPTTHADELCAALPLTAFYLLIRSPRNTSHLPRRAPIRFIDPIFRAPCCRLIGEADGSISLFRVGTDGSLAHVPAGLSPYGAIRADSGNASLALGDANGDGRADLVEFRDDQILVALSTGASFSTPVSWPSGEQLGCYTGDGATYSGGAAKTASGLTCQAWSSQTPQAHDRTYANYPSRGLLDGDGNHCRNPDGEPGPWCYTTDANTRWESCSQIPQCVVPPSPILVAPVSTCSSFSGGSVASGTCSSSNGHTSWTAKAAWFQTP